MPYLTKPARKGLDRLSPHDRSRALQIIDSLDGNPGLGKPLQGPLKGRRSVRFGRYRIIHTQDDNGAVVALHVRTRQSAHRPRLA